MELPFLVSPLRLKHKNFSLNIWDWDNWHVVIVSRIETETNTLCVSVWKSKVSLTSDIYKILFDIVPNTIVLYILIPSWCYLLNFRKYSRAISFLIKDLVIKQFIKNRSSCVMKLLIKSVCRYLLIFILEFLSFRDHSAIHLQSINLFC